MTPCRPRMIVQNLRVRRSQISEPCAGHVLDGFRFEDLEVLFAEHAGVGDHDLPRFQMLVLQLVDDGLERMTFVGVSLKQLVGQRQSLVVDHERQQHLHAVRLAVLAVAEGLEVVFLDRFEVDRRTVDEHDVDRYRHQGSIGDPHELLHAFDAGVGQHVHHVVDAFKSGVGTHLGRQVGGGRALAQRIAQTRQHDIEENLVRRAVSRRRQHRPHRC